MTLFVTEEVMLHIPELDLGPDGKILLSNPEKLEQCVMNWQTHLTVVLEEQRNKKPQVCDSCILRFKPGRLW